MSGFAPQKAVRCIRWTNEPEKLEWCREHDTGTIDELSMRFEERFGFPLSRPQVVLFRQTYGKVTRKCHTSRHEMSQRVPVGTMRMIPSKGYAVVKFAQTSEVPGKKDNWKPLHVCAYESMVGALPADSIVVAADGNPMNVHPENLVAVPKQLIGIMNCSFGGWTNREELMLAMAQAKLKSACIDVECSERECAFCGRMFVPERTHQASSQRTCPDCVADGRKSYVRKPKGTRACAVCGEEFTYHRRNDRRCPECIRASPSAPVSWQARHYELTGRRC